MPYKSKWIGGPKSRLAKKKTPTYRRRFTKLLPNVASDHIARPPGGGSDVQKVRARLTQLTSWTMTAVNYVTQLRGGVGSAAEWSYYAGIYDQFKVHGMKVTIAFPTDLNTIILAAGNTTISSPECIFASYDNDSITPPASLAVSAGYSTFQQLAASGVVSYSVPTLPKGAAYGATGGVGYVNSSEWTDVATPLALAGIITATSAKGMTINGGSAYAVLMLFEWDVTFQGKRN